MGFLSESESASLEIKNMILHVVSDKEFRPEPARSVEHQSFFVDRVRDTDAPAVYSFEADSPTQKIIEMIADGSQSFEVAAQNLSRDFASRHNATSREGAFFMFELATGDPAIKIYSFIKYDYRQVIEQRDDEKDGTLLRRIVQAFVEDKKAIQKSALVRVANGKADALVATRDRMKVAPEIGEYFAAFLHVRRTESDEQLNKRVVESVRQALAELRDFLPDKNVSRALVRAKAALRARREITEDAIVEAVVDAADHPADERTLSRVQDAARRKIKATKLAGLAVKPDAVVLQRPATIVLKTVEGVTLSYPSDADGVVVKRKNKPGGKGAIITIETAEVTHSDVVRDSARGTA